MWVWIPILGKQFQTQLSEMERWWPAQYFVNSGLDGERAEGWEEKAVGKMRNPLYNLLENLLNTWPVPTIFIGLILGTKEIKDRGPSPAWAMATRAQQTVELWDTLGSSSCKGPSIVPTATRLFAGGSRKQEMRDCKAIKILLAICPSSHRAKDLLL